MRESIQTLGVTIFPTLALSEVKWSPQSPCVSLGSSNGNFSRRNAGFPSRTHQAQSTFTTSLRSLRCDHPRWGRKSRTSGHRPRSIQCFQPARSREPIRLVR